jgi:transposase
MSGSKRRDSPSSLVEETAMTVLITRLELTPEDLRREAGRTKDAAAGRRMLAIALVLEGHRRGVAARQSAMDGQTLRDWAHRYNAEGIAGLFNRPHGGGPPRKLTAAQEAEIAAWISAGPDAERDGVVRWRLIDLGRRIVDEFNVPLHERSIGKLVHRLGFRHISVRPRHPQADASAQEAHKKTLPHWLARRSHMRPVTSRSNYGGRTKPVSASKAA